MEEKLTLAFHRNCLILLGKLPLRQIVIKLRKWLLTEGLAELPTRKLRISCGAKPPFWVHSWCTLACKWDDSVQLTACQVIQDK